VGDEVARAEQLDALVANGINGHGGPL
jgi:hypothetical protein